MKLSAALKKRKIGNVFYRDWMTFYSIICFLVYILDLGQVLRLSNNGSTSLALIQLATFHFAHRDFNHLASNISILLLISPNIQLLIGTQKLWEFSLMALFFGAFAGSFIASGIQGTSGLVLAFAIFHLLYAKPVNYTTATLNDDYEDTNTNRHKIKRIRKFPKYVDSVTLIISIFYLCKIFIEYPSTEGSFMEDGSEFAHLSTAFFACVIYPRVFGLRPEDKVTWSFKLPTRFSRLNRRDKESRSKSDSDSDQPTTKGNIYSHIPSNKLKPNQRKRFSKLRSYSDSS